MKLCSSVVRKTAQGDAGGYEWSTHNRQGSGWVQMTGYDMRCERSGGYGDKSIKGKERYRYRGSLQPIESTEAPLYFPFPFRFFISSRRVLDECWDQTMGPRGTFQPLQPQIPTGLVCHSNHPNSQPLVPLTLSDRVCIAIRHAVRGTRLPR